MAGETEMEKKEKGFVADALVRAAVVLGVITLYVLSTGPVTKYVCAAGMAPNPVVRGMYAPLIWLCQKSSLVNSCMAWYIYGLWSTPKPSP